ncbi:transposase [Faecalibacillus faecis]|uniref:transposase n=1 Tax=Faecalibacillus faecis TaxID=1982628 RepID=UPI0022DF62A9|nr:transposase [Faecalibacillus faecis]
MHMKYDYYNHTNVFKPGYNVQIGVSDGYIRNIYISSDGNDLRTYIPFMDKYKSAYGRLPKKTPADAEYGSYDNYNYCKENNIELYMKYSGYYKSQEKTNEKNKFHKKHMKRTEEGNFICPADHEFELEK